jgi:hypothetical protein
LEELLIVSEVVISVEEGVEEPRVAITPATGEKCPRCWNYRTLGGSADYPEVCERCADVLRKLGFETPRDGEDGGANAAAGAVDTVGMTQKETGKE